MPEIRVEIDKDGEVAIEGIGFKGSACKIPLDTITKAVGRKESGRTKVGAGEGVLDHDKCGR